MGFPGGSVGICQQCRRPQFGSWVRRISWRRDRMPTAVLLGFPCGSAAKESTYNVGDLGLIPVSGRSLGEGKGYPLQYFGLENSMDCIVHGVTKSQTWLSDFHFLSILGHQSFWFSSFLLGLAFYVSILLILNLGFCTAQSLTPFSFHICYNGELIW